MLNIKLNASRNELKQSNDTKNKLFSIIAHDLKNPFSILYSLSNFLTDKFSELDDSYKMQIIDTMKRAIVSSNELVENLLNWSLSQSNKISIKKIKINICELINDILESLTVLIKEKNIEVSTRFSYHYAFADIYTFSIIIRNLIINAVKFSDNDREVRILSTKEDKWVRIDVIDSGIGLSTQDIKKLFRADIDISKIGKSKSKGTGLGLLLCKEFVEANGGMIKIKSTLNMGTQVSVYFQNTS
jgi:two-component system sensor histidine kinase/response regulator